MTKPHTKKYVVLATEGDPIDHATIKSCYGLFLSVEDAQIFIEKFFHNYNNIVEIFVMNDQLPISANLDDLDDFDLEEKQKGKVVDIKTAREIDFTIEFTPDLED